MADNLDAPTATVAWKSHRCRAACGGVRALLFFPMRCTAFLCASSSCACMHACMHGVAVTPVTQCEGDAAATTAKLQHPRRARIHVYFQFGCPQTARMAGAQARALSAVSVVVARPPPACGVAASVRVSQVRQRPLHPPHEVEHDLVHCCLLQQSSLRAPWLHLVMQLPQQVWWVQALALRHLLRQAAALLARPPVWSKALLPTS